MSWSYRAVQQSKNVAVFAVYKNSDGNITSSDAEPYVAIEPTKNELVERLELILHELKNHPSVQLDWLMTDDE